MTVGFIDPGNWASNVAAGAEYGYTLLWMVTLSTLMLIVLQHNAAHLGIATGLCLSEAAMAHLPRGVATWAQPLSTVLTATDTVPRPRAPAAQPRMRPIIFGALARGGRRPTPSRGC